MLLLHSVVVSAPCYQLVKGPLPNSATGGRAGGAKSKAPTSTAAAEKQKAQRKQQQSKQQQGKKKGQKGSKRKRGSSVTSSEDTDKEWDRTPCDMPGDGEQQRARRNTRSTANSAAAADA